MPKNWQAREKKLDRRKNGMIVSNRSMKSVILPVIAKKATEGKKKDK
jgi:hypothetical protein